MTTPQASTSSTPTGLSEEEARRRLESEGPNELPHAGRRPVFAIIAEVVREPMLALLIVGGVIYFLLGDRTEALMLLAFACLSVVITVVQEARTDRVLEALRDLTSPRALVIRDGKRKRIAGREVVRGDLLLLGEGDRVAADARLVRAENLNADESLLTGESLPVAKEEGAVYSGSLIVRGSALAEVTATGAATEIGKIGASLRALEFEPPRMQREVRRLVRVFGLIGGAASLAAILLYGFLRGGWLDALLAGIALGMSMLPEEFPVVLTVFMAMGAWRISRARVLTRKAAAIESLGAATVLCTDKTGTLTENRMSVEALKIGDGPVRNRNAPDFCVDADAARLIETASLASAPDPVDPMESAFHRLAKEAGIERDGDTPTRVYGLDADLLAVTQVWRRAGGGYRIAAKGAPEAIAGLCALGPDEKERMLGAVDEMAAAGLRVIAIAHAEHGADLPETPRGFRFEYEGLAGLADPLRSTASAAVAECRAAGVRVVMITGDYPVTARAIAEQAGIDGDTLVTGEDINAMNDEALAEAARTATVFARVRPEQKLRIVNALKADGEIVAMTGDGVNDAPALKAAHIGVAMGGRGTDVAREASSIVLVDDDFSAIVTTLRLGRRIHDNLRKATAFILSVHVPIAGMALLPLVTGLPIVFGPVHIAFLEMVIDPVCSLVLEAEREEPNVMKRPPRSPQEPLLTRQLAGWSLAEGFIAFALIAAIYFSGVYQGLDAATLRASTFVAVVSVVFSLILANRTYGASILHAILAPNAALAAVAAFVAVVLSAVVLFEPARTLFDFAALTGPQFAASSLSGMFALFALEALKKILGRKRASLSAPSRPRVS